MKKSDTELQVIREKLQSLQGEPSVAEAIAVPWCDSRSVPPARLPEASQARPAAANTHYTPSNPAAAGVDPSTSPQAIAIETLKQRSGKPAISSRGDVSARTDSLVSQEIYRLEVLAHNINTQSRQQAADILAIKRSAQQAALALGRQGIHNHPQLATIAQFLEHQASAVVPHLEKDAAGFFNLTYDTIDFHQAQQEAVHTAEVLRSRQVAPSRLPFSQPIASDYSDSDRSAEKSPAADSPAEGEWLQTALGDAIASFHQIFQQRPEEDSNRDNVAVQGMSDRHTSDTKPSRFSWIDGAIWFSGAAIVRRIVEAVVAGYPLLQVPFLLLLFGAVAIALYRVIFSKSSDTDAIYRVAIAMLGLFVGGSF